MREILETIGRGLIQLLPLAALLALALPLLAGCTTNQFPRALNLGHPFSLRPDGMQGF